MQVLRKHCRQQHYLEYFKFIIFFASFSAHQKSRLWLSTLLACDFFQVFKIRKQENKSKFNVFHVIYVFMLESRLNLLSQKIMQNKSILTSKSSSFGDWLAKSWSWDIFRSKMHWWSCASNIMKFSKFLWINQHASPDVTCTINHSTSESSFATTTRTSLNSFLFYLQLWWKKYYLKFTNLRSFLNTVELNKLLN